MARPTYAEALTIASSDPIKLLSMLVSLQEPDGTGITGGGSAVAFAGEVVTVAATAIGGTAATYAPSGQVAAQSVYGTVEGADIRIRYTGTNPTAAAGHLVLSGGHGHAPDR